MEFDSDDDGYDFAASEGIRNRKDGSAGEGGDVDDVDVPFPSAGADSENI